MSRNWSEWIEEKWDSEVGTGTLGIYAITAGRIWYSTLCFNLEFREDIKNYTKEKLDCMEIKNKDEVVIDGWWKDGD